MNSYSRLIPGYWAPTVRDLGRREPHDGAARRSPAARAPSAWSSASPPPTQTPTSPLAAALASGLWGIENAIEPEPAIEGNAYDKPATPGLELPRTLWEAAQALKASQAARTLFGDAFVDHFAATREWEEREFRKHITDWELARYFEII